MWRREEAPSPPCKALAYYPFYAVTTVKPREFVSRRNRCAAETMAGALLHSQHAHRLFA